MVSPVPGLRAGALLLAGLATGGCALKSGDASAGGDELGGVPGAGGSGEGGGGAPSGSGATPGAGLVLITNPGAGGAGAGADGGDECAVATQRGEIIEREVEVEVPYEVTEVLPKSLYIMLDRSGSMVQDNLCSGFLSFLCGGGGGTTQPNKWALAVDGLTRFVTDPASATLGVALQYFPGGNCDGTIYDTPAVPMGRVQVIAGNIISSLSSIAPNGNTPTAGALRGLISYCANFNATIPTEECVGVLVTDGDPTACDPQDDAGLQDIVRQGAAGGVKVFIAGMQGATFSRLHALAQAAGTDCTPNDPATFACDMTADRDAFLRSLQAIQAQTVTRTRTETRTETQSTTLECEWKIPPPPEGQQFDSALVNVKFSGGPSGDVEFGYVAREADCAGVASGWYYDDPNAPTTIKVCPQTCETIKTVSGAQVDLLLGCQTKPAVIN